MPPPQLLRRLKLVSPNDSDSDSNSNSNSSADDDSSADDNSSSCVIVESVGNKGKTSFVCLSGDVRRVMMDKVKVNASTSEGNPNASSHEIAKMMLHSVVARRTQLIELAVGLDATIEIPDGVGKLLSVISNENNQDLCYRAHGGYLGHHVDYVEDRSPPQNRYA